LGGIAILDNDRVAFYNNYYAHRMDDGSEREQSPGILLQYV